MDGDRREVGVWQGGKYGGSCARGKSGWTVRFYGQHEYSKYFGKRQYGGYDEAYVAAEDHRRQYALEHGLVKNLWRRRIDLEGEEYIEVQLQDGEDKCFTCDPEDLPLVEENRCYFEGMGDDNFYVVTGSKKVTHLFHRNLHPEWKKIDHIDRNALNNRRLNLRDGSNGVNERNQVLQQRNTSGVTGVFWCKTTNVWIAHIMDNGVVRRRIFRESEYNNAKEEAIAQRQAWAAEAGNTNGQ